MIQNKTKKALKKVLEQEVFLLINHYGIKHLSYEQLIKIKEWVKNEK